jgi:predicted lipid-binding transport protein (Tim44 family)
MLAMFLWSFFARRRQPDLAMQGAGMQRQAMGGVPPYPQGGAGGMGAAQAVKTVPIQLGEADFGMFERLLGEAQTAYANEDFARLKRLATDEMMYYFRDDIEAQKKRGLACRVSDVKLLQGDLSEAWREGADEYATVAMRFSMIDVKVDRNDGRVVEGDANRPVESTEVWTFVRPAGSGVNGWVLSAIQQTA